MSSEQAYENVYSLQVTTTEDKLKAMLSFSRAEGQFTVTVEDLIQKLTAEGIKHGIQYDMLSQIAAQPLNYIFAPNLIAVATAAKPGTNGYVKVLYDDRTQENRPAEREDGSVDFREMKQLANVKAGQLIATRVPPLPGVPGTNVLGDPIVPKEGKEAHFKVGKNVVLNPEKTAMYAAIDGLVTHTDKEKLNVFPVYEVNGDVDYNIGNIDFVGTVVIRGNVLTGFRIRASGDIRVTGGIEGAEVESDGSIEISGGIIGSNKGHVKAGVNVKCSFIQEGNVIAAQDVVVSQSIMHSSIRAGRNIVCAGAKGLIVGGLLQSGEKVIARTIGNVMSTTTSIEVGVKPELRQELSDLRVQSRLVTENLDKTEKALAMLNQLAAAGQLTADRLAMRIKLTSTKRQMTEELKEVKSSILVIEKSLEDTDSSRVEAIHTIYGGTKIVIGRYTRFIKDPVTRASFQFTEGEITMAPYQSRGQV